MIGGAKGIGIGIDFGIPNQYCRATSKPYIEKDVLDSLRVVASAYGKSNNDADRSIVKNLVDASNPFIISNAAFKLNSGFGKYEVDFKSLDRTDQSELTTDYKSIKISKIKSESDGNAVYTWGKSLPAIGSVKIRVRGLDEVGARLVFIYLNDSDQNVRKTYYSDGIYDLPSSSAHEGAFTTNFRFAIFGYKGDCNITIEQIPSFEGAFVTDGIDDLITSTKTAEEMLGGSTEFTAVSMIHLISPGQDVDGAAYTNYIRTSDNYWTSNRVSNVDKTGIYGYSFKQSTPTVINNILGDKGDYTTDKSPDTSEMFRANFSVEGFKHAISGTVHASSVAWYWTIIANKVLTTDQINQVIAYFNLDRTLNPDILCNTIKQGITNENHAEFGDKLIDFSGNGRDIQLNNIAWKGDSGIGKYNFSNINIITSNRFEGAVTTNKCHFTKKLTNTTNNFCDLLVISPNEPIKFKVSGLSDGRKLYVANKSGSGSNYNFDNGEHEVSLSFSEGVGQNNPFGVTGDIGDIDVTVEFIPSHAGGLCLDGINDFGKVTGMPVYKDYTVIADYERISGIEQAWAEALISKSYIANQGAFVLMETNGMAKHSYSFGAYTTFNKDDSTRTLLYQSKYKCGDVDLNAGTGIDGDTLWLGTYRDNYSSFFNGAIYSLMSFPYSMSEFLIERQLKKHKLGTLYPNMVEFRPVIKSSVELASKPTFVIRGTSTLLNAGDYIPENSEIWVVITMNNAADRITKFVINGNTIDIPSSAYNPSTMKYGFPFTINSKSPQKITMTIEPDENYVQWNPVVTSNVEYIKLDFYLNNYEKRINIGDYIPKDVYLRANIYLKNNIDELTVFTFNGVNIDYKRSVADDTAFNIGAIYNYDSPQEVNITIDEYIRYEDIVQPYPSLVKLENLDRTYTYTWGDKLKVGDTIRYNSSVNLLKGAYTLRGQLEYNGVYVFDNNQQIVVTKEMVFAWSHSPVWTIDNNEPKSILSPRLLSIPNSSYKILGHIPDISGHGNNGKINNSAYAGMSGANGYSELEFSKWRYNTSEKRAEFTISDDVKLNITKVIRANGAILYTLIGDYTVSSIQKYKVTGVDESHPIVFGNDSPTDALLTVTTDGEYEVDWKTYDKNPCIFATWTGDCNITIQQIGEYEGAYCLDGVDDFVTIPTLSSGGKQVLMKVNWNTINSIIYDQRGSGGFAIYCSDYNTGGDSNTVPAYKGRNTLGTTYIDGIRNEYIIASQLRNVTHNIVEILDTSYAQGNINPIIGKSYLNANYGSLALYDFMLFDEISTDDKIQELNEYVGVKAKVEKPDYYWDAYGKTNSDEDKATIQQRGVAVGDYDLINYNHAYEGMSGYNGYPIILSGTNRTYQDKASYVNVVGDDKNVINLTRISSNTAAIFSYVKQNGALTSYNKDIESFKIKVTGIDYSRFVIKYSYISEANATAKTSMTIASDSIYELPKSFTSDGSLTSSDVWIGFSFTKQSGDMPDEIEDVNVTIEVLPEYENGLVYDGVEDYSDNKNIPIIDDFTVIAKRTWLEENRSDKPFIIKGDTLYPDGNQNAFLFEYGKLSTYSFGQNNKYDESVVPSLISWATPTSYNGTTSLVRGSAIDTVGIDIAHATKMVFYKLILYPKTISLLEINFLKNLMEKDEIIDLTNPIFIQ